MFQYMNRFSVDKMFVNIMLATLQEEKQSKVVASMHRNTSRNIIHFSYYKNKVISTDLTENNVFNVDN